MLLVFYSLLHVGSSMFLVLYSLLPAGGPMFLVFYSLLLKTPSSWCSTARYLLEALVLGVLHFTTHWRPHVLGVLQFTTCWRPNVLGVLQFTTCWRPHVLGVLQPTTCWRPHVLGVLQPVTGWKPTFLVFQRLPTCLSSKRTRLVFFCCTAQYKGVSSPCPVFTSAPISMRHSAPCEHSEE